MPRIDHLWALIAAGGTGTRIGGALPKQLVRLEGKPLIVHALERLLSFPGVLGAVVAMNPSWMATLEEALPDIVHRRVRLVEGGGTRQESVLRGLEAVDQEGCGAVLVHDAARPLLSAPLVSRILEAFDGRRGVVPVIPVPDSVVLRRGDDGIERYIDRSTLALVQTPQLFPFASLLAAHRAARKAGLEGTDDASIFLAAGGTVVTVEGEPSNLKVTYPSELAVAEALLRSGSVG